MCFDPGKPDVPPLPCFGPSKLRGLSNPATSSLSLLSGFRDADQRPPIADGSAAALAKKRVQDCVHRLYPRNSFHLLSGRPIGCSSTLPKCLVLQFLHLRSPNWRRCSTSYTGGRAARAKFNCQTLGQKVNVCIIFMARIVCYSTASF